MFNQYDRMALRALALAMLALTISFVSWGLLSPLASFFQERYGLTNLQISTAIAAPVLLGSLGRIPVGGLTDRYGGRRVFSLFLLLQTIPLLLMGFSRDYATLLAGAVLLGLAGAGFAAGAPFISGWFPPKQQGFALGVYGMGNMGSALAALYASRMIDVVDWPWVYWAPIPIVLLTALLFYTGARDAPRGATKPAGIGEALRQPLAWLLSFWYLITFGGFVAFGGYLPKLYQDVYGLNRAVAAGLASTFVFTATFARPVGGWLSDRLGGRRTAAGALLAITITGALLTLALPLGPFRLVTLALAVALGVGNGAVFKLLPQLFPATTGAVTGLVGALGGLGGFFPPLLMGFTRDRLGTYTPAFVGFALAAGIAFLTVGALAE